MEKTVTITRSFAEAEQADRDYYRRLTPLERLAILLELNRRGTRPMILTLPDDLKEFVALLNAHEVRYLIVGGYAVAYHGYPRFTGDMDFFLDGTEDNARKIETVLNAFGFGGLGLTAQDFTQPDMIVQLGYPPNRIDLLTTVSGVTFADAWTERVSLEADGVTLVFIGKQALLANKSASGRPKDIADIDALT